MLTAILCVSLANRLVLSTSQISCNAMFTSSFVIWGSFSQCCAEVDSCSVGFRNDWVSCVGGSPDLGIARFAE